ncbi:MAG: DUF1653 domain-containing protein [Agathobacter sp.]|nr:DUF1653 domain-containing protein [Agathobacter sp.]
MQRRPEVGETYRHFKEKNYKIIAIAHHSETGEELVIYQALYGDGMVCARPLDMFVSEVDHEKYPDVKQKYRFEKIADAQEESKEKPLSQMSAEEKMMAFFDEDDLEARYQILLTMREDVTNTMIDNMAVVMDIVIPDGNIQKRYDDLKRAIQTKQRYEQNMRLR